MSKLDSHSIESFLKEKRKFSPSKNFAKNNLLKSIKEYDKLYKESIKSPEKFWKKMAEKYLHFFHKGETIYEFNDYRVQWFSDYTTNVSYNCLDRHLTNSSKNKAAIIWEGENGEVTTLTYLQLSLEVNKAANMLKSLGVKSGDRIAIYLPLIPEAVVAMLACTRIGAPHTVIFGGFSSQSLQDRINDSGCKILITADGGYRKGVATPMKNIADLACENSPIIQTMIVVERTKTKINMQPKRDFYWSELMAKQSSQCEPEKLAAEHPLFILYTSGTTGKPKGLLHTTAGYLLGVTLTSQYIFDIKDTDVYWCTADIGWITGHSYVVYGPLSLGATVFIYEGAPTYPNVDRFWQMIAKHKITTLYTAPTAIRMFIRHGSEWPLKHDLSSLRLLGSVGEPINPEAWMWYFEIVGNKNCPIVDTWWQTETGAIMISPIPSVTLTKPGSATLPFFGIDPVLLEQDGTPVQKNKGGLLCIKKPWPSIARTIYGDHERYKKTYWQEIEGVYFTGDGAHQDEEGYFWIMGRVDDVVNVSGHRLGTMEVESAIVQHESVAECAVVGKPDSIKGQSLVAFVTLKNLQLPSKELKESISKLVEKEIGAIARPEEIRFTEVLPKTRSGKIMRRLLRELAASGSIKGDTTTLEDFSVIQSLQKGASDEE
ncbi:MAG: acetate--CoA ligase [Bdellovibrionota bacterium]